MCVTGEIEHEKGHFVFFYYIIFDTSRYVSSSVGFKCLKSIFDEGRKELYIIPLSSNWILYFPDGIEIFPFAWIFKLGYFSTCCIYYTFTPTTIRYKRIFAGKERSYLRSLFKSIELSFQRRKNLFVIFKRNLIPVYFTRPRYNCNNSLFSCILLYSLRRRKNPEWRKITFSTLPYSCLIGQ